MLSTMVQVRDNADTYTRLNRFDPTKTTFLRQAFITDLNKRFRALRGAIRKAIVDQDCFGLADKEFKVTTLGAKDITLPGTNAFAFSRNEEKVQAFMDWLKKQEDAGILEIGTMKQIGTPIETAWTNKYIMDSYKRGVQRARQEMINAGYKVPSLAQTGGIEASMSLPMHLDRLGVLYSRVFQELKGITSQMDTQISRVLTQGIADGVNPRELAQLLTKTISGPVGDLSIKDTLGRFIPAERRAQTLARTEIIRAHHQGNIQEMRNWAAEGVTVKAEWTTAGYKVCPECSALEGKVFTLDEIQNKIPLHPNCLISRRVPIYTSEGWKQIGDVAVGDLVLTHKGRFRKVIALHCNHTVEDMEVIRLYITKEYYLTLTGNHPVLVNRREWKRADKVQVGDFVSVLTIHSGEYEFVLFPIQKIGYWFLHKNRQLYNLSVEEDESYIAKGMIVHNCRCCAIPVNVKEKR